MELMRLTGSFPQKSGLTPAMLTERRGRFFKGPNRKFRAGKRPDHRLLADSRAGHQPGAKFLIALEEGNRLAARLWELLLLPFLVFRPLRCLSLE